MNTTLSRQNRSSRHNICWLECSRKFHAFYLPATSKNYNLFRIIKKQQYWLFEIAHTKTINAGACSVGSGLESHNARRQIIQQISSFASLSKTNLNKPFHQFPWASKNLFRHSPCASRAPTPIESLLSERAIWNEIKIFQELSKARMRLQNRARSQWAL